MYYIQYLIYKIKNYFEIKKKLKKAKKEDGWIYETYKDE